MGVLDSAKDLTAAAGAAVKNAAVDAKDKVADSFPEKYDNPRGPGGWDIGVATLIIPASITAVEALTHEVIGVKIPHGINTFFGTVGGCLLAVWFARRFRPH
jgi:hypothetical protein